LIFLISKCKDTTYAEKNFIILRKNAEKNFIILRIAEFYTTPLLFNFQSILQYEIYFKTKNYK